jgi:aspartate-semialdehyde dehydrogenase
VRALSFTGSTEIGRLLYARSAATVKRLVLELGGHAPFLVFADADLDRAVDEAIKAKFATTGQDCLGANRFSSSARSMTPSASASPPHGGADRGRDGRSRSRPADERKAPSPSRKRMSPMRWPRGAKLLTGGGRSPLGPLFYQPTVLADVPDAALIIREETFGPVAAIAPFDTEDEAIARANATEYGLIAYLHTRIRGASIASAARCNSAWSRSTAPRSPARRSPSAA